MKPNKVVRKAMFMATASGIVGLVSMMSVSSAFAVIKINFAHHLPAESEQHMAAERFRDLVAEYSNGEVQVQILPSGQMGGQREIIESVELGTLEMGYGESGLYANYVPGFGLLTLPFLYRDTEHWEQVVTGEIGDRLIEQLVDTSGVRPLNWILAGYRDTYLVNDTIESPDDFKNLKIRVPESPVFVGTFSALGAQPTPVPMPDVYTAMQTGLVDAMEGTPEVGYTFRIYEVAESLSKTRHILFDGSFAINENFYNNLSDSNREAVTRAAQEAAEMQRGEWAEREQSWLDKLTEEGIAIIEVDPEPFQDALASFREKFAADIGAVELLESIDQQ
ncbi:TRAP transporter substrate-binding protein [Halomonas sp. A29]|uniref:TRAP transporter substrate-binding protein n=1 Tax=Halomonas sp. A29 TaxID=3102786 RepID=UPI00398B71C9